MSSTPGPSPAADCKAQSCQLRKVVRGHLQGKVGGFRRCRGFPGQQGLVQMSLGAPSIQAVREKLLLWTHVGTSGCQELKPLRLQGGAQSLILPLPVGPWVLGLWGKAAPREGC